MILSAKVTGWPVLVLASVLALCVAGCSSDDSGESQGTFNDGPVENLDFEVDGKTGKTGPDGGFAYRSGTQITFSVGGIVLGSGTVKAFMTPVDLVPGAEDENNDTVTNIARFLQTLDEDGDLSNGIQIPEGAAEAAAGRSLDFEQTPEDFENDPDVLAVLAALTSNSLVSTAQAREELRNTILARLAGDYGGAFTGSASGCWSLQVDATGAVTGTFDVESNEFTGQVTLPLTGSIPSSGNFTLTGSMPPFTLNITGAADTDGGVSGNWSLLSSGSPAGTGTFSGGKDESCEGGDGNGNGGGGGDCTADGLPGKMVRFSFSPFDGAAFDVDVCGAFECQDVIVGSGCALQVFDIAGSDRFFQFLTTTMPFQVNINFCFGFDFVVSEPGVEPNQDRGLSSALVELTGRQFGVDDGTPFAQGTYSYRDGSTFEELGTVQFFEFASDDGFIGFQLPTQACPSFEN
jgi:hypothetical protein